MHPVGDASGRVEVQIDQLGMRRNGERAKAEPLFRQGPELSESFAAYTALGRFLRGDPDTEAEAEAAFQKATTLAEDNDQVTRGFATLAGYYYQRDRFDEAVVVVEQGIEKAENPVDLIYLLARMHRAEGNTEEADALVERATQLVRPRREGLQHDRVEVAVDAPRPRRAGRKGRGVHGPARGRDGTGVVDLGRVAGQERVEHRAQRVDVGAHVGRARPAPTLGTDEARGPDRNARDGHRGVLRRQGARDPEVDDHRRELAVPPRQEDVGRLQVAVQEAALVQVVHGLRRAQDDVGRAPDAGRELGDGRREGLAADEVHDEVGAPAPVDARAAVTHHARVIDRGEPLGLAPKALEPLGRRGGERHELDRDPRGWLAAAAEVDRAHAAAAEQALDAVGADRGADDLRRIVGRRLAFVEVGEARGRPGRPRRSAARSFFA